MRIFSRLLPSASIALLAVACSAPVTPGVAQSPPTTPAIHAKPKPLDESRPAHPPRIGSGDSIEGDEVIRLSRSGCAWACPSYSLSFFRDGTVIFNGRSHTAVSGEQRARIDDAAVADLLRDLQQQLPAIAGRYTPDSKTCGQMFTDQATTTLSARLQQGLVSSERYGGCPAAPKALAELEKKVDAVAQSGRWVSKAPTY